VAGDSEFQEMRHPNYRRVKIHFNYTLEETAKVLGVHRNTVREWIRRGLPTCDDKRPVLILGHELAAFLRRRRTKDRKTCAPGEIYCVRCRTPRTPAGCMADYQPKTATLGNLIGLCPICDAWMYRRVNRTKLDEIRGPLEISCRREQDT
jgi:DNA-binding XRE family transcriptional regulator